jgi:hypothetical protein
VGQRVIAEDCIALFDKRVDVNGKRGKTVAQSPVLDPQNAIFELEGRAAILLSWQM